MTRPVVTTGGRQRVDLGRLDPSCAARYHGTYTAYHKAKCRCPHAREAYRLYQKRHREGRAVPVLVEATGTRRRIQALWRVGHPSRVIAAECGGGILEERIRRFCRQPFLLPGHRDLVKAAYQVLIVRPGSSAWTRNHAAAAGYPLPVQWGADIDDPNAVPEPLEPEPDTGYVDEDAIELTLSGRPLPLTDQELIAAVQIGTAREIGPWTLAHLLSVDARVVRRLVQGDVLPRLGAIARRRAAQLAGAA